MIAKHDADREQFLTASRAPVAAMAMDVPAI
jgi:hypothetical protein